MKNKSHLLKLIFSTIIFFVTILVYFWMQSSVGSSVENVLTAEQQAVNREVDYTQSKTLGSLYNSTAGDRAKLQNVFVSSDDIVSLIKYIEGIGSQTGSKVTISSIVTSSSSVKMQVSAQGSWGSIFKTLILAESLPYVSTINSVDLETSVLGDSTRTASLKRSWQITFELMAATK